MRYHTDTKPSVSLATVAHFKLHRIPLQVYCLGFFGVAMTPPTLLLLQEVDSAKLWSMTWTRIDQFLPGFLSSLFPSVTPPPPPPTSQPPPSPQPPSQPEQGDSTQRLSAQSESTMASAPISVSQSPTQSPDRSPHASPPSSSPGTIVLTLPTPHVVLLLKQELVTELCARALPPQVTMVSQYLTT